MKKIILILFTVFSIFLFVGCNKEQTKYNLVIHYSLNEKEDINIDFTNINEIKLENIELEGYNFLGYYENDNKIEEINELRNYNLETKYEELEYKINIHYTLGEKEDEIITFTKSNIDNIKLEELNILNYKFLGYFEGNNKIEKINELRDYNLETKYEELEYEININYSGIDKDDEIIQFTASTINDIVLEKEDVNKLFLGFYENNEKVTEIKDLRDYNLEARYIDYDILFAKIETVGIASAYEQQEYIFDRSETNQCYGINVTDELNDFCEAYQKIDGLYSPYDNGAKHYNYEHDCFISYIIPITNDIINNEVVFCDIEISDTATLIIYNNSSTSQLSYQEFYQEYEVNTDDYLLVEKESFDLKNVSYYKSANYIINILNGDLIECTNFPITYFYLQNANIKEKWTELLSTTKYEQTGLTVIEYLNQELNLDISDVNKELKFEATASVIINGEKIEKKFDIYFQYNNYYEDRN